MEDAWWKECCHLTWQVDLDSVVLESDFTPTVFRQSAWERADGVEGVPVRPLGRLSQTPPFRNKYTARLGASCCLLESF